MFPYKQNLLPKQGYAAYFPLFLDGEQANSNFHRLLNEVNWQQYDISIFGRKMAQPRLTAWYGEKAYSYSGIHLPAKELTVSLLKLKLLIEQHCSTKFNSVLLNLYRNEKDSMGWHSDDEKELGSNPIIASLSLGSERNFQIRNKLERDLNYKLSLQSGSLLVMKEEMQHYWQHAISKSSKPCGARINLTFRWIN
jgi:alkylated DNA repair dioxygenase AlkB